MKVPTCTYRLQFNQAFDFDKALPVLSYLADLGVSDIYASPIFRAKRGSTHGYDIVNLAELNPELGGKESFDKLSAEAQRLQLGWIQDIVPNHMAFDSANSLLMDVFENGPDVLLTQYFDIIWDHPYEVIRGKLLAPLLGDIYAACLERGEIVLEFDKNGFFMRYYHHKFPLRIDTYATILEHSIDKLKESLGENHVGLIKLTGLLVSLRSLPAVRAEDRKQQVAFVKELLWELYEQDNSIQAHINQALQEYNGTVGVPQSYTLLDNLHSMQFFKLSYWKVANEELNYRRFFTVNDLISVRIEDKDVFDYTHALIKELISSKQITGLRVDHIDGLYNPREYLLRLREIAPESYLIVEKILAYGESLPQNWPVQGNTGYDFLNYTNSLLCDWHNDRRMSRIYIDFTGLDEPYEKLVIDKKRLIINYYMAGDIENLALLIKGVSGRDRRGADITMHGLRTALVELLASFPVYRSYCEGPEMSSDDHAHIEQAIERVRQSTPGLELELNFIERFLLLQIDPDASEESRKNWLQVVMRFQQFTGPLMAKGFEDTLLYVYNRLASLNEVGGWPGMFGISSEAFHHFNSRRQNEWPFSMNATSTHDTKHGEDARARIAVLSEIPQQWQDHVKKWSKKNLMYKSSEYSEKIPDANDEYLLYQTIIGTYPLENDDSKFVARICQFMLKAVREAKVHTGWIKEDSEYENGLLSFIKQVLDKNENQEFYDDFIPFVTFVSRLGIYNSLTQLGIKLFSPGVADFYQGSELWDFSLVDPDNRNSVDFDKRRMLLKKLKEMLNEDRIACIDHLLNSFTNPLIKMFVTYVGVNLRKKYSDLIVQGKYVPLHASGMHRDSLMAFARKYSGQWLLFVCPKQVSDLINNFNHPLGISVWEDTSITLPKDAPTEWIEQFTLHDYALSGEVKAGEILTKFPLAVLTSK